MRKIKIHFPLTVPWYKRREYKRNYTIATRGTGRLFMFACDQKVEHLNEDFFGEGLAEEIQDPEHLFRIAKRAKIGAMATQLGLIAKYGRDYRHIPYIIKLNSKTNILKTIDKDPYANAWYSIDEVMRFKRHSKLPILGVGYTVYIGSWYESEMFRQAAEIIFRAHKEGLLTVLWMYPRGKAVLSESDPHLIAGGAGLACSLGADFVKIHLPKKNGRKSHELLKESVSAAGRTGVICVGGPKKNARNFLTDVSCQLHIAKTRGVAVGRNIFQRPLDEAVRMANAISALIYGNVSAQEAYQRYVGK